MLSAAVLYAVLSTSGVDRAGALSVAADVNAQRQRVALQPLIPDERLNVLALDRANDMVRRHYFDHVSPDGRTALDELRARAYAFDYAGENIAIASTPVEAERGLWNSPQHRQNMLEQHFKRVGIAVLRDSGGDTYVVQIFSD